MRLSIPTPPFFFLDLSSSRLPLLASPYVSLCIIFDYSTSYVESKAREGYDEAAYKGRDACETAKYNDKRQLLRDLRRLLKHARLPSARPKEAADKGFEKASEAWEITKGKAFKAVDKGSEKAAEA